MKKGKYKKCKNCGIEFYEFPYLKGKKKFCSTNCANKYNAEKLSKDRKGKGNPMYGKRAWNYKGFTITTDKRKQRYKLIYVNRKQIKEHRYIMEQYLGRKLKKEEVVHHINGDSLDNRIENLKVMTVGEHSKLHFRQIRQQKDIK